MISRQHLALCSAAVLFLGVFAPIVSLPIVGNLNYFQNGHGDGVFIIGFAVLAVVAAFAESRTVLWIAGLGSLAVLVFTFVNFQLRISDMHTSMEQDLAGNPFRSIADAMVQTVQIQWGWALLMIGAGGILLAAGLKDRPPPRRYHTPTAS